ncbi:MAG: acyl dehydratase [Streptosporangiales bacterium]|nr:acyl dehydratase [Streptosporangiales bacterium]MBO0891114.1 hypothetical protein [Acidothermales bacterium]
MTDVVRGPFFDELSVGRVFDRAPSLTLTRAHAAVHQAIVGDRLRLPLDEELAASVVGKAPVAHPALVWDLAIGQSTLVTQHVRANLFYRGLAFRRFPVLGDTLSTVTEVAGLRQNRKKPGRAATGMALLRVRTTDQHDRPVLDFHRCAMLPMSAQDVDTGHHDDLDVPARPASGNGPAASWRLDVFRERSPGEHFAGMSPGRTWHVAGADVVSAAPELARLTLNIAAVHHDEHAAGGRRLVYGGHTIGLALAQVTRAIPDVVTVLAWDGCDHVAPVYEGDAVTSTVTAESVQPLDSGGGVAWLRVDSDARTGETPPRRVLTWRLAVLLA